MQPCRHHGLKTHHLCRPPSVIPTSSETSRDHGSWREDLHFGPDSLIPAIAQDWLDGGVLMMAWMNGEALERTLISGEVHYWSRSRQQLWHKGATSGQIQTLKGLRYDCDADALLLSVEQRHDVACHTGARSCFFREGRREQHQLRKAAESIPDPGNILPPPADACTELYWMIAGRRDHPEKGSYTNHLFEGSDNRILKKIGEESAEFVMACKDGHSSEIASEAADLVFHLQVALAHHGVDWREVLVELARRRGAPRRSQRSGSTSSPKEVC